MSLNFNECGDEKLLEFVAAGSREAFAALVKRHLGNSYKNAFKFLRSKEDAEDVVQECFLKLWKSPQKFDSKFGVKFSTWFYQIIRNRSLDFLKKRREEFIKNDFDIEDSSKNQLQIVEENLENIRLEEAVEKLSDDQKRAINLFFYEDRKHKEAAQIMGLSLKAFQSLLMRSKKSLKLILTKTYE